MADFKETCFDYLDVDDHAVFTTSERKWVNKILKLKESNPDNVVITTYPEDNNGYIVAHVPKNWFKLSPPRQVNYTDEQRQQIATRLRSSRDVKNS